MRFLGDGMAKCFNNPLYVHGKYSGFTEYRYGTKKPVTVSRVFTGKERRHLVNDVIDLARDWRLHAFEKEGVLRHSLRSGLCLSGETWSRADREAELVLQEAFTTLGAKRPTWEQGQPEYTVPEENCKWCGVEIPEEERRYGRKTRYCSTLCASAFLSARADDDGARDSETGKSAFRLMKAARLAEKYADGKTCRTCGDNFIPTKHDSGRIAEYCSSVCYEKSLKKFPKRVCRTCTAEFQPYLAAQIFCSDTCMRGAVWTKICQECGSDFTASSPKAKYCCNACVIKSGRKRRRAAAGEVFICIGAPMPCEQCGTIFEKKTSGSRFCSETCRIAAKRLRNTPTPNVVPLPIFTLEIFDGWFKRAA